MRTNLSLSDLYDHTKVLHNVTLIDLLAQSVVLPLDISTRLHAADSPLHNLQLIPPQLPFIVLPDISKPSASAKAASINTIKAIKKVNHIGFIQKIIRALNNRQTGCSLFVQIHLRIAPHNRCLIDVVLRAVVPHP